VVEQPYRQRLPAEKAVGVGLLEGRQPFKRGGARATVGQKGVALEVGPFAQNRFQQLGQALLAPARLDQLTRFVGRSLPGQRVVVGAQIEGEGAQFPFAEMIDERLPEAGRIDNRGRGIRGRLDGLLLPTRLGCAVWVMVVTGLLTL
jgi:hypothetical protein